MHKVGDIQATHTHTHTVSSTPIAAVANANQVECQRERGGFYLHLGWVDTGHGSMTVRNFGFFERWCVRKARQRLTAAVGVPGEIF